MEAAGMNWEIAQVCLVVFDLEETLKNYWEKLGIGPWNIRRLNRDICRDYHFNGELCEDDFEFECACCWVGGVELEICQPVTKNNPAYLWLSRHGEGLHHIKMRFPDEKMGEAISYFEDRGMKILHSGRVDKDVWYYPDTVRDLKINIEIGNSGQIDLPARYYPEAAVLE